MPSSGWQALRDSLSDSYRTLAARLDSSSRPAAGRLDESYLPPASDPMQRRIHLPLVKDEVKVEFKREPWDDRVPGRNETCDLSPIPRRQEVVHEEFADAEHDELVFEDEEEPGEEMMDIDMSEEAAATPLPETPRPRARSAPEWDHDEILQARIERAQLALRQAGDRAARAARRADSAEP